MTEIGTSMSQVTLPQATPLPTPEKPRFLRRIGLTLAFFLGLLAYFWSSGQLTGWLHGRIDAALKRRDYEAAEDCLHWVQRLRCANAETEFWHARVDRKLVRLQQAVEHLEACQKAGFDLERLARESTLLSAQSGQLREVMPAITQMLIDPRDDGQEICEAYVNGALFSGANDLAKQILEVWKSDFPHDPQAHYAHAKMLDHLKKIPEAEAECQAAIACNPEHWPSRYLYGRILFDRNQIEPALAEFKAALGMRHNAAPEYQRARCLKSLGKTEEAATILRELVKRPLEDVQSSFTRVGEPLYGLSIQQELGSIEGSLNHHEEAIRWLSQVLEDDPKNLDARYARATSLRRVKRLDEAEQDFKLVQESRDKLVEVDRLVDEINQHPEDPQLEKRCRVGELFLKYESGRHAAFWLQDVLNRDPQHHQAHVLLAEYYSQLALKDSRYEKLTKFHQEKAKLTQASP